MNEMENRAEEAVVAAEVNNAVEAIEANNAEEAVVVDNEAGEAVEENKVEEAVEENNTVKAASLLAKALDTSEGARKRQNEAFGRHFSSTKKREVIKAGAEKTLQQLASWQHNLESLLKEIEQEDSIARVKTVVEGADNLSAEEVQQMIAALESKLAAKAG